MKFVKENISYLLLLSSVFFLRNPSKFPADDGFFYPQIAYNIVHHGFMGFNDLYLTNGFHPLWMFFCVFTEFINPFDKEFSLYILWFFQVFFIAIGYRLLEISFFKGFRFEKIFSLAFLCLMFFSLGTLYLTEAHLAFFVLCILLYFLVKKSKNDILFGLICSCVFLARLDHIFIIISLGFYYWKQQNWNMQSLMKIIIGFSILSVPYLFSNQYLFGNIVPISGKIKSSFPYIQNHISFGMLPNVFIFVGFSYFLFLIFIKKTSNRAIKFLFLIGSIFHLIYNLLFQSQIGQWYFVSQMLFCNLFIYDMLIFLNFKIFKKLIFDKIILVFLLIFVCIIGWLKLTTSFSIQNNIMANHSKFEEKKDDLIKITAKSLEKILPKESRIYVYDFPGKLAFYSGFNVIPADGLVANKHYFKQLNENNFEGFLSINNTQYLLLPYYLNKKNEKLSFLGINVEGYKVKITYEFKNAMEHKIVGSLRQNQLQSIKNLVNPIKTWQPEYDSIAIYKLKKW